MVISNVQVRKVCQVPGCPSAVLAKGYCIKHYYQVKRHGAVGTCVRRRGVASCGGGKEVTRRWSSATDASGADRPVGAANRCTARGCQGATFDQRLCRLHFIKMRYLGMAGVVETAADVEVEREDAWEWMAEAVKD